MPTTDDEKTGVAQPRQQPELSGASSEADHTDQKRPSAVPDYGATGSTKDPDIEGKARLIREKLRPKKRTKEEQTVYENNIKDFLDALLSNTSLLAISNIVKRSHPVFKTLWAIAFTVCLVLSIRQLYSLSWTYFSEPKSTVIQLSYKPFAFPSVTVCNHNPLRRSMVSLFGQPSLQQFLAGLETKDYSVADNGTQLMTQQADWVRFHRLISNHTPDQRMQMGYQMSDLILQCSFGGNRCNPDHFSVSLSKTLGNCFTFNGWQPAKAGQQPAIGKNGREHGLIMTMYLELEEYLQNFIPSSGIKVHIHDFGSLSFPETSGFSVPPGFQTSVGVSLRHIDRINRPVGSCRSGEDFRREYGFKYTHNACTMVCLHNHISHSCGCYDRANSAIPISKIGLQPCQTAAQLTCLMTSVYAADQGDLNCDCPLPCEESHFIFKQSLSEWPTDSYETRLFGDLVDVKPKIARLTNKTKIAARRNLLNLIVFVDGVMAEHIIEKSAYGIDNYLSDIGGTLGLFLGFSVLTGFELLEATALILAYLCGKIGYTSDDEEPATGKHNDTGSGGGGSGQDSEPLTRRRGSSQIMTLYGSNPAIHLHSN